MIGYTNVKVFQAGMPAWKKAAGLVITESASLSTLIKEDYAHVLIDLRDKAVAEKGFIKGAVTVPASDAAKFKDKFPKDLNAAVILYSDKDASDAFKTVRSWGYKNAAVLNGGVKAWTDAGNTLETGKLATEIVYVYKPRPGEVVIDEFAKLAKETPKDKLILDVRDASEVGGGMIKGAVNIPVSEIDARLSEIPKDKEIIAHCVTGVRAQEAYAKLLAAGYKVRYLRAIIQIAPDGTFEITKE